MKTIENALSIKSGVLYSWGDGVVAKRSARILAVFVPPTAFMKNPIVLFIKGVLKPLSIEFQVKRRLESGFCFCLTRCLVALNEITDSFTVYTEAAFLVEENFQLLRA